MLRIILAASLAIGLLGSAHVGGVYAACKLSGCTYRGPKMGTAGYGQVVKPLPVHFKATKSSIRVPKLASAKTTSVKLAKRISVKTVKAASVGVSKAARNSKATTRSISKSCRTVTTTTTARSNSLTGYSSRTSTSQSQPTC